MADLPKSYNDWPNHQGFNTTYQEREPVELQVTGVIPEWAAGVLFRTGVGPSEIQTESKSPFKVRHWFDSMAIVHRFQILAPDKDHPTVRVAYNSRSTCDKLIENIEKTGERSSITFGRKYEPCTSFFQKVMSVFQPTTVSPGQSADELSMSITLSVNFPGLDSKGQRAKNGHASGIQTLCNKTDASRLQMLDPQTLEPIGIAEQSVLHPDLKGQLSSAHAKSDPVTGDVYNYNLDLGRTPTYRIFHVSASTGETSILATLTGADAAYIHSFFLSENYVILCVWNAFFATGGSRVLWHRNIIDALEDYDATRPARWYVIDRRTPANGGRGVVATYESSDFYCFHTINAYETPSSSGKGKDIVADLVTYDNIDCLKRFYLENIVSTSEKAADYAQDPRCHAFFKRFRLPCIPDSPTTSKLKAELELQSEAIQAPELPTLNHRYITRPHRYVYGVNANRKSTFFNRLVKFDTETKETKYWSHHGQNPGEAIFIPRPASGASGENDPDEDDGVLLSVVLDGIVGKSYLLVLDAKTMKEVGRADVDGVIGHGIHGTHISSLKNPRRVDF